MSAITERWTAEQRWTLLLTQVLRRWLGGKWLPAACQKRLGSSSAGKKLHFKKLGWSPMRQGLQPRLLLGCASRRSRNAHYWQRPKPVSRGLKPSMA